MRTARIRRRPICRTRKPIPSVAVEREQWDEDTADRLAQALETLDERSQHILRSRWMTDEKATLHELADEYGVSAERIRQIEANAIKKLRGLIAEACRSLTRLEIRVTKQGRLSQ